jgi:hypothetical protein
MKFFHRVTKLRIYGAVIAMVLLALPVRIGANCADDLADLLGYTIVAVSTVAGDFEGADFDKPVKLENGMVFEFSTYSYTYSYRPRAAVLARNFTQEELTKMGVKQLPAGSVTLYKLLIRDRSYSVRRIR